MTNFYFMPRGQIIGTKNTKADQYFFTQKQEEPVQQNQPKQMPKQKKHPGYVSRTKISRAFFG